MEERGPARGGGLVATLDALIPRMGGVRVIATDMDGTLLQPGGALSDRTVAAVRSVRRAGLHVVPVTGRPPRALWALARAGGLGPLGVCANGAAIVDLDQRVVLELQQFSGREAAALIDAVRVAVPGVRLGADDLDGFFYEVSFFDAPVDWEETLDCVEDVRPRASRGCMKLVARASGYKARELIAVLAPKLLGTAQVTSSGPDWVEIGPAGVSKAAGMARVCDLLGCEAAAVAAIGDNHNDLPLLLWATLALAPANAIPEAVAAAHHVLPANTDHGVATLFEALACALS